MIAAPCNDMDTSELEKALQYRFTNRKLLQEALTHRSFCNECGGQERDNERLEFFGDAVIDFFLSHLLLDRFPNFREGELTKIRASLVGEENLGSLARLVGLGPYLRLGRGEDRSGGREKKSLLADAYEALIAAIYLDGGFQPVRRLMEDHFEPLLAGDTIASISRDSKTEFQELAQATRGFIPRYAHRQPVGPDHQRIFTVAAFIGDKCYGEGSGTTKKEAEQAAARAGLECLRSEQTPPA